jgi:hypothetical protein
VDVNAILDFVTNGYPRVWVVLYHPLLADPQRQVERWLLMRGALVTQVYPSSFYVYYFNKTPALAALPPSARPLNAEFGGLVALRGVELPVTRAHARDLRLHPPSTWVHVRLFWQTLSDQPNVTPRVRFTAPNGAVYGEAVGHTGGTLAQHPPLTWLQGVVWEVASDLNINPNTPPGVYNIEVMVLGADGAPLPATGPNAGAQWAIAGQFEVLPPLWGLAPYP